MCCNVLMGDKAAIKNVKYRYLRALDTKHWDDFADTLTDDIVGDYGSSPGEVALHQPGRFGRLHALHAG